MKYERKLQIILKAVIIILPAKNEQTYVALYFDNGTQGFTMDGEAPIHGFLRLQKVRECEEFGRTKEETS